MYERFTSRARKVMELANQEALRFNHQYICTEHILLALVKEGSGCGANALKLVDIDLRKVRLEVEKIIKSAPGANTQIKLPQTPLAEKVIEFALDEARSLEQAHTGTEHILLGLIRVEQGVASQVLKSLESHEGEINNAVHEQIEHFKQGNMTSNPLQADSKETAIARAIIEALGLLGLDYAGQKKIANSIEDNPNLARALCAILLSQCGEENTETGLEKSLEATFASHCAEMMMEVIGSKEPRVLATKLNALRTLGADRQTADSIRGLFSVS